MKKSIVRFLVLLFAIFSFFQSESEAQRRSKRPSNNLVYDLDTLLNPIPYLRKSWHVMKIDDAQKTADLSDGMENNKIEYIGDTLSTKLYTQAIIRDVNQLQVMIENLPYNNNPNDEGREKIQYLKHLYELVKRFNTDTHRDPVYWKRVITTYKELVIAKQENKLYSYIMLHPDMYTYANVAMLDEVPEAKAFLYTEIASKNPESMIKQLANYAKESFACDIIAMAAVKVPNEIYNYASSTNNLLNQAIRSCTDSLTKTIVRITDESKSPLRAMPFLSDIFKKRKTIQEIDSITADPDLFFKNLVRLKLENEQLGGSTYSQELMFRGLRYVRFMNDLHEEKDIVRFKSIEGMSAEDLYFIMVYGQDEIYTSSFVGTFKRMMDRLATDSVSGDQLLHKVHFDKFRTFIRMCAGYNTLSTFLASMSDTNRLVLMKKFINGLDQGDEYDLEDAVDVADAFGSINDPALLEILKKEVLNSYERSYKGKSMKGMKVYALLNTLFSGMKNSDNAAAIKAQSDVLNLPPINLVPFKTLLNDSGIVYQQFFFYGDEDGKSSYNNFLGNFRDGKWKKTDNKYWTTIVSTTGKPIVIFANLPLSEPEDEDAQKQLNLYLKEKKIRPTIIVHRGHSYHLTSTMENFDEYTKLAVLGSCGGYHNLGTVLSQSPEAHIISSKQTGMMAINDLIVQHLNAKLLEGGDIEWIKLWKEIDDQIVAKNPKIKSMFNEYVPPHKNLGAIFIKSYKRLSASDESKY